MPVQKGFSAWCGAWHALSAQDVVVARRLLDKGSPATD